MPAELLFRHRLAAEADQMEIGWQQIVEAEIIDRGKQLARREIAGGTKNHDDGWRRAAMPAQTLQERVTLKISHARNHYRKPPEESQNPQNGGAILIQRGASSDQRATEVAARRPAPPEPDAAPLRIRPRLHAMPRQLDLISIRFAVQGLPRADEIRPLLVQHAVSLRKQRHVLEM